jgi:hypothetical protein
MNYIPWSDDEKRILRETYPEKGIAGTIRALKRAGYHRTHNGVNLARKRYGIPPKYATVAEAACRRQPRPDIKLSPERPITPDSVELAHWFAGRGFSARRIAEEINRPVEAIRKALRMQPPAIDTDPYWPRRDDMILGRAIT